MMRKKVLLVVVAVALLLCVLASLCACESYKATALSKVGDKNAVVESNGGLVVKQGGYLYFVNGFSDYLKEKGKDNWFGNVVKGAIVRVTYHTDGSLGDDMTVVVPKSVMASSANVGFSIFGEWIYYVSPSAEEDRSGAVQTDTLQFLRTKIDGTDTQLILNWNDTAVQYKYTRDALVYFDSADNKLYSKDLTKKKFKKKDKGTLLSDKVASVYFPENETYDPAEKATPVADYVLYTKNAEDSYEYGNTLYISDPKGKDVKTLIGPESYADGKYNVKVLSSSVTDDKLAIYYTKTSYVGTSSTGKVVGTFAYEFADKTFAFNAANEKTLSATELSDLFPISYAEGVVKAGENAVIYHTDGSDATSYGDLKLSTLIAVENSAFYYLNADNVMLYYPLDKASNAHFAYKTGEKVMSSFTGAEYFDGYFYFILDDDYKYMARVKLADIDVYSAQGATVERVSIFSAKDKEAYDKAQAEKEKDKDKDED